MINYSIGGFTKNLKYNLAFIDERELNPHIFQDNVEIKHIYDSFPNVIWNGGRMSLGYPYSINDMTKTIKAINDRNIGVRFTYTNSVLDKKYLNDYLMNKTLELAHNEKNGIIVYSNDLKDYIRKNFPLFKIISSITDVNLNKAVINNKFNDFDVVVIPVEYNFNIDFLSSIRDENKDKVELLINEYCLSNCKYKNLHFKSVSQDQINFDSKLTEAQNSIKFDTSKSICPLDTESKKNLIKRSTILNFDDVKKINDIGISNFKIKSRSDNYHEFIESYCKYLIKPEYWNQIFEKFQIQ